VLSQAQARSFFGELRFNRPSALSEGGDACDGSGPNAKLTVPFRTVELKHDPRPSADGPAVGLVKRAATPRRWKSAMEER